MYLKVSSISKTIEKRSLFESYTEAGIHGSLEKLSILLGQSKSRHKI